MFLEAKTLVLILATSTLVTEIREEMVETAEAIETIKAVKTAGTDRNDKESKSEYLENLAWFPCIQYPITFQKKSVPMVALLDLGSKVNAIHPIFTRELGLPIRPTDIRTQKIDSIMLDTFEMVIAAFLVTDKANQVRFFKKTFLVINVSPEIVFRMLLLTLSDADINFLGWDLR